MAESQIQSPVAWTRNQVRDAWQTLRTVYYANTVAWRFLKSGALVFLGLFLWASSNVLLSYNPSWRFLHYPMAYGVVLVPYGPFHHFVVIPLSLRLKRRADDWTWLGGYLPNASLAVFLTVVVLLGTFPVGTMTVDFTSDLEGASADIDPDLYCVKATNETTTRVHCHLSTADGISAVAVETGGERLLLVEEAPFDFTFDAARLEEVVGQKQFQVVLLDEDGETIRRYTRTMSMIDEQETVD